MCHEGSSVMWRSLRGASPGRSLRTSVTTSCGSRHIAVITRVPMSVQRQRFPPHQNSCPIVNSLRLIAGVVDD
jgi:hypothetical protein